MKNILILTILIIGLSSCLIDIRQLPSPKKIDEIAEHKDRKTLIIRNFKVLNNDLIEIENAWKYVFISYLQYDAFLNKNYIITDTTDSYKDTITIDILIKPYFSETRNYWWSIPIIYPISLIWPIHYRKIDYSVSVEFAIQKNEQKPVTEIFDINELQEIYFYGLTRTFIFEEFIEDINYKALTKCVSKISLYLSQF